MVRPALVALALALVGASPAHAGPALGKKSLSLRRVSFTALPGWKKDRQGEALSAFLASCKLIEELPRKAPVGVSRFSGRARDWLPACRRAARIDKNNHRAARAFFERQFRAYEARGQHGTQGKLTGYYVQHLRGSMTRHGRYQTPIMSRPADLLSVELSTFIADGGGRRIWGRRDPESGSLVPYPTRAEIRKRGLEKKNVLLWVDDPIDAVFAEIQGSGKVTLDTGKVVWIAFDGKNGRRFRGVGGILRRMGELARGEGTMQGIRAWFEKHPERYNEIVDKNPAKVFFEISDRAGAIGSQDVVLTPRRSMAVDRGLVALSTPIWVDTVARVPASGRPKPWRRLVVAQDTGGAIRGPVRGDIYWGDDAEAAAIAGRMGASGRMWLLLPRTIPVR